MNQPAQNNPSWKLFKDQGKLAEHLSQGVACFNQQNFAEAETHFRMCLEANPQDADVLNYLAGSVVRLGKNEEAVELAKKAISIRGEESIFHNTLGIAYLCLNNIDAAYEVLSKAVQLSPYNYEALFNFGRVLFDKMQYADAARYLEMAFQIRPDMTGFLKFLADSYRGLGRFKDAEETYRKYFETNPADADALNNFAFCLEANKKWDEALQYYKKAFELNPKSGQIARNYGAILNFLEKQEEGAEIYRKAIEADPTNIWYYSDLIQIYARLHNVDKAYLYAKAMETLPDFDPVQHPMAERMVSLVCDFEAEAKTTALRTERYKTLPIQSMSPLFLTEVKYCTDEPTTLRLTDLHRRWGDWATSLAAAHPVQKAKPLQKKYKGRKKIKVGFLSSDLRTHVVSKFFTPLITNYDKAELEIVCYSLWQEIKNDNVQNRIRNNVAKFDFVDEMYDSEIVEHIRNDELDVLIELNGHTADNRVQALAHKLAPVQAAWLGYPLTWGVKEIDYNIVDLYTQPENPKTFVEDLLVMPNCYLCYPLGLSKEPDINPVPAFERNGRISFGTMNNPIKYSPECIYLWANAMLQVPNSRFVIVRPEAHSVFLQQNILNEFMKYGIEKDRIFFVRNNPGIHFDYYGEIDISLDVVPLTGGTTTCESMSMGVPVVTRYGDFTHTRLSRTFITNAGLPELCAGTDEQYVEIAANLAHDTNLLRYLHGNLRGIMSTSPLCDQKAFANDFAFAMNKIVEHHGLR